MTDKYHYEYFLLGDSVPVKVWISDQDGLKAGAEIPDAQSRRLKFDHSYLSRLEQSEEVTPIDQDEFDKRCAEIWAKKNASAVKEPHVA